MEQTNEAELTPEINVIFATNQFNQIGYRDKDGNFGMPWPRIKEDMKFFRIMTEGHSVVMGYNTWLSLGEKPLPRRNNIVVTSKAHILSAADGKELPPETNLQFVDSIDHALEYFMNTLSRTQHEIQLNTPKKLWVIGGGLVYQSFFERYRPLINKVFHTVIHDNKYDVEPDSDNQFVYLDYVMGNLICENCFEVSGTETIPVELKDEPGRVTELKVTQYTGMNPQVRERLLGNNELFKIISAENPMVEVHSLMEAVAEISRPDPKEYEDTPKGRTLFGKACMFWLSQNRELTEMIYRTLLVMLVESADELTNKLFEKQSEEQPSNPNPYAAFGRRPHVMDFDTREEYEDRARSYDQWEQANNMGNKVDTGE